MLDYRLHTFLTLCETKSYTKAAEQLFITQPAVTQQIKYLEKLYGVKLFTYQNKVLSLTEKGGELYDFVITIHHDSEKIVEQLCSRKPIYRFGATLTVGDYLMPEVVGRIFDDTPDASVSIMVDNTQSLLNRLKDGVIDFAVVEGMFDKTKYESTLLSKEELIGVCASGSKYARGTYTLEELLGERVFLREKGSGTREVFENYLKTHNLTPESFWAVCETGSLHLILSLVAQGHGISFLYRRAAGQMLGNGVSQIRLAGAELYHEFYMVCLKNSKFKVNGFLRYL